MPDEEIWKQLWYKEEVYLISNKGNIKNSDGKAITPTVSKAGCMTIPGTGSAGNLSRLVPKLFLPAKKSDEVYVHRDGNFRNFNADNFILQTVMVRRPIEIKDYVRTPAR